jgi:hypothetical protein
VNKATDGNQVSTQSSGNNRGSASAQEQPSPLPASFSEEIEQARFNHLADIEELLLDSRREFSHKFLDAVKSTDALLSAALAHKEQET